MKLYYSPGACSLAPHIVLQETNTDFELIKVNLATKITEHGENFLKINPHGYIPTLQLDTGEMLAEGVAIIQYLADQNPQFKLAPENATFKRAKLYEILNYLASEVHKNFIPLYSGASDEAKCQAKANINKKFNYLNAELAQKPYLLGNDYSVADIYLFVISNWTKNIGIDLTNWANLATFSAKIAKRTAVQKALKAEGLL
ncbi:Glutathione S-transferase [hydrothermal vent metagenome]|uniref:Glutathione S-transferase n=1 Tax=hydrothermal vent metagenome TaxID=652676 RepID=A0A3B0UYL4_9ZZZZ